MTQLYGKTQSEEDTEAFAQCRQIVGEIARFGVTQRQYIKIIELIAMELEDRNLMLALTELTKSQLGDVGDTPVEHSGLIL